MARYYLGSLGDSMHFQTENQEWRHVTGYEAYLDVFLMGPALSLPPGEFPLTLHYRDQGSSTL